MKIKDIINEFKIIRFPNKNKLLKSVRVVIMFSLIYIVMVGALDMSFSGLLKIILNIK